MAKVVLFQSLGLLVGFHGGGGSLQEFTPNMVLSIYENLAQACVSEGFGQAQGPSICKV